MSLERRAAFERDYASASARIQRERKFAEMDPELAYCIGRIEGLKEAGYTPRLKTETAQ
jgi:hypothetical protein